MRKTPATTAVLRALLEERRPYGLAIARATGMNSETVYRTLARLEAEDWVTSRSEKGRRTYRLTAEGRRAAEAWFTADPSRASGYVTRRRLVEAIRWQGTNWEAVSAFAGADVRREGDVLWVRTPDGDEACPVGYWIVRGVKNFYPVDQETFDATFEVS